MALPTNIAWEISPTGTDTNSGGFTYGAIVAAPSAPSVAASAGGSVAAATYYCVVTYTDGVGETVISGETSVTTSAGTQTITVTSPGALTGAVTWSAYFGTASGGPYFPQGTGLTIGSNRVITATPPTTGTQPRGVDRSLQNGVQVNVDNSTITAGTAGANSNVITFTGYTPTGADVGNVFRATGGTNINVGPYVVTAITSTTWTVAGAANLTTAGGAGAAITGVMGGALATPGGQTAIINSGAAHWVFCKAGTYTIGGGTINTAGNKISSSAGWIGYSTHRRRGNTDTPPVWDAAANGYTMFLALQASQIVENISFTNSASHTTVTAFTANAASEEFRRCSFDHITTPLSYSSSDARIIDCYFNACGNNSNFGSGHLYLRCVSVSSAGIFLGGVNYVFQDCISFSSTSNGIEANANCLVINCSVYQQTGVGIAMSADGNIVINCIVWGKAGSTGINNGASNKQCLLYNCAVGNNSIVDYQASLGPTQLINCVTLTADPFTDAAGGDYSLNDMVGGGALCRGAGIPGTWPGLSSTTGHRDIGAVQTSAAGAGGATRARVFTGM